MSENTYYDPAQSKIIAGVQVVTPLSKDYVPGPYDVIISSSSRENNYSENYSAGKKYFRSLLKKYAAQFCQAYGNEADQRMVLSKIVMEVRRASPMTGGFILKQQQGGRWYRICDDWAREEIRKSIRIYLHSRMVRSIQETNEAILFRHGMMRISQNKNMGTSGFRFSSNYATSIEDQVLKPSSNTSLLMNR